MKKTTLGIILIIVVSLIVAGGITLRSAIHRELELEQQGHTYRTFFIVLEMYTEQTDSFPTSLEDMLLIQERLIASDLRWPEDALQFAEAVEPNFNINPNADNLNLFTPGYKQRAGWGEDHCESSWARIVEHCTQSP